MMKNKDTTKPKTLSRKSPEVIAYIQMVEKAKLDAEVVTLREWYDSTSNHNQEIIDYMAAYKQLGPLGKELHKRGVKRVTERFGDNVRTLVEATYQRRQLDIIAPLCAFSCVANKKTIKR
jgi:putative IMPACT (imprinted ancient) family translation regulator